MSPSREHVVYSPRERGAFTAGIDPLGRMDVARGRLLFMGRSLRYSRHRHGPLANTRIDPLCGMRPSAWLRGYPKTVGDWLILRSGRVGSLPLQYSRSKMCLSPSPDGFRMASESPVTRHVPVLVDEVLHWLDPRPGQIVVDGTLGSGGHSRLLAQRVGQQGRVIALDRDPAVIERGRASLQGLPIELVQANFCNLPEVLTELDVSAVDGVLLDLGLSSDQLADPDRGFSFDSEGPLDMRFDPAQGEPAWRLVNKLSERRLADLIYQYGEERHSRRIARRIVEARRSEPIRTARRLAELVRQSVPRGRREHIDPATRTFQALRIAVNDEIESLERALERIPDCLRVGGRLAVISFHSLEDRPVKTALRDDTRLRVLTRRPVRPTETEVQANPRSRSARLRVAERMDAE